MLLIKSVLHLVYQQMYNITMGKDNGTDEAESRKKTNFIARKWQFYKRIRESLQWHHEGRDLEELEASRLPDKEKLELQSTWITEAYTSSDVDALIKSLKKLGWHKADPMNRNHDLASWIRNTRSRGGWSWANGGVVRDPRRKTESFFVSTRFAELPEQVEYAHLSAHKISSSIVVLSLQFVYTEAAASSIMEPLQREDYRTYAKYYPSVFNIRSATYITPERQKQDAYNRRLDELHAPLYRWFRKNIPGHFSSLKGETLPTVDLITSHLFKDKETKKRIEIPGYLEPILGLSGDMWSAENINNLKLLLSTFRETNGRYTLFGNYKKLVKGLGVYGGGNRHSLMNMLDQSFPNTVCILTAHELLLSYEKSLSQIRDRSIKKVRTMRKALKDASYVRDSFLSVSRDAKAASKELGKSAKKGNVPYLHRDTMDFIPPTFLRDYEKNLIETISSRDALIANELADLEQDVREAVMSSSTTASSIANLRIQRWVFWLTVATAIFAIVNIIQALGSSGGK